MIHVAWPCRNINTKVGNKRPKKKINLKQHCFCVWLYPLLIFSILQAKKLMSNHSRVIIQRLSLVYQAILQHYSKNQTYLKSACKIAAASYIVYSGIQVICLVFMIEMIINYQFLLFRKFMKHILVH
jgi:hypothetical protein